MDTRPLIIRNFIVGPFQCNCAFVYCSTTKEAVVIDPGDEFPRLQQFCIQQGIQLKYALHTHAHLDHIGAAGPLKKWAPHVQLALHQEDEWLFKNLQMQGELFGFSYDVPPPLDLYLQDGQEILFGKQGRLQVIHTPGHSPGGVCLHLAGGLLESVPVLFTGDTLFDGSIGRTDLWGADFQTIKSSIKQKIFTMDESTKLLPGHGGPTTVWKEKKHNPFVSG